MFMVAHKHVTDKITPGLLGTFFSVAHLKKHFGDCTPQLQSPTSLTTKINSKLLAEGLNTISRDRRCQ